jgi:RNA-binding motif protein, X-linked 2
MNVIAEITRINRLELDRGIVGTSASWHQKYQASAWVYCGNLPTQLSEGDLICILSQYGEVEDVNLVRDNETGVSKGFCFCKYEDQRSTVLAVDNLTGAKILGRSIRVDHVEQYRLPKELLERETPNSLDAGHAYQGVELENSYNIHQGQDLFGGDSRQPRGEKRAQKLAKLKRKEERDSKRRQRDRKRQLKEEKKQAGETSEAKRGRY